MAAHDRVPHFTPADVRFLGSLAPELADGVRRATLMDDAAGGVGQPETGFLVLAADDSIEMANPAAEQWIDELAPVGHAIQPLPFAIRSVVVHTRRVAAGGAGVALASAPLHTRRGHWVVVRGSLVGPDRVAVLLEAARPSELASAIADACGLTERERAVTELVARGLSTNAITDRLHLSAYTIQDHLKAIFDKTGARSRGELVARLFFDHCGPGLSTRVSTSVLTPDSDDDGLAMAHGVTRGTGPMNSGPSAGRSLVSATLPRADRHRPDPPPHIRWASSTPRKASS